MTQNQTPKIHATWPPGCYGSYVVQSIYAYSNLSITSEIIIDPTGSSHTFRDSEERKKYFKFDHEMSDNSDIIIGPVMGHELDYFVNQFVKGHKVDKFKCFDTIFKDKLKIDENFKDKEDWQVREWISFWISDVMASGYNFNPNSDITTNHLFDKNKDLFPEVINCLIKKLGLLVVVDIDTIKVNHEIWKTHQRFHNLQKRCDKWISEILNTQEDTLSPCITIIDEAYVQNRLRSYVYEIRCFGLNTFPKTSHELRSFLYKESQDDTAKTEDC